VGSGPAAYDVAIGQTLGDVALCDGWAVARSHDAVETRAPTTPPSRSARVLVLAPGAGVLGLALRRSLEQERVVRGDEPIGCHHGVGVVHGFVLAGEGDEARAFAQTVLELGADLPPPVLEPRGGLSIIPLTSGISCACSGVRASPKSNGNCV